MRSFSFLYLFVIYFLTSCAVADYDTSIKIPQDEQKIVLSENPGMETKIKSNDKNYKKEYSKFSNIEVLDSSNDYYRIKRSRCSSAVMISPFVTGTIPLSELFAYLRSIGAEIQVETFQKDSSVPGGHVVNTKSSTDNSVSNLAKMLSNNNGYNTAASSGDSISGRIDKMTQDYPGEVALKIYLPKGGTLCDVANIIRMNTKLWATVENNVLTVSPYERKAWRLPVTAGDYQSTAVIGESTGQVGQQSGTSASGSNNAANNNVFGSLTAKASDKLDLKPLTDLQKTVTALMGGDGFAIYNQNLGLLTVYVVPERMDAIQKYIESVAAELSRSVKLYVTILKVQANHDLNTNVDWATALRRSLVTKPWNYGLTSPFFDFSLKSPAISNTLTQNYAFGVSSVSAPDQQRYIVSLLNHYANTTTLENANISLVNGYSAIINHGVIQEYLSSVNKSVAGTSADISHDVVKGTIYSGVKLYASGMVREDTITLTLFLELQALTKMDTVTFSDVMVQNPTIDQKQQVLTLQLKDGDTTAVAGVLSENKSGDNSGPAPKLLNLAVGSIDNKNDKEYLVVLITPEVVKTNRDGGFHEIF